MLAVIVLISIFASVSAKCDNACSGHGTCGLDSICTCYDNWGLGLSHDSGDCSQRICPYDFAWVDTPDKKGNHHKYAECSAKGICNRDTGDCECFPGFEGKGCQRATCPNECSGHGQCTYIEDLPYNATASNYFIGTFWDEAATLPYYNWDKSKSRACICDPEYGDVDCSKRMCPHGTDVMDVRDNLNAAAKYHTQNLIFDATYMDVLSTQSFALVFKSKLNETFVTKPLVFESYTTDLHDFVLNVQAALMELPNRVIDKVEVHASQTTTAALILNVTFVGDSVQGPQNLLTVRDYYCADGCTPKLAGAVFQPHTMNVTELRTSDFNSFECGRRGKCDYSTGICNCFAGYTGLSCNTITALV